MKISREQIRRKLLQDLSYKEEQVDDVINKLLNMPVELQDAFVTWFEDGIFLDSPSYQEYTPVRLWDAYQLKPAAVFLLLDWIRRQPEEALAALTESSGKYSKKSRVSNNGEK